VRVYALYINNRANDPDLFTDLEDATNEAEHKIQDDRVRKVVITETHVVLELTNPKYVAPGKRGH
jgi:hypothetical protein